MRVVSKKKSNIVYQFYCINRCIFQSYLRYRSIDFYIDINNCLKKIDKINSLFYWFNCKQFGHTNYLLDLLFCNKISRLLYCKIEGWMCFLFGNFFLFKWIADRIWFLLLIEKKTKFINKNAQMYLCCKWNKDNFKEVNFARYSLVLIISWPNSSQGRKKIRIASILFKATLNPSEWSCHAIELV